MLEHEMQPINIQAIEQPKPTPRPDVLPSLEQEEGFKTLTRLAESPREAQTEQAHTEEPSEEHTEMQEKTLQQLDETVREHLVELGKDPEASLEDKPWYVSELLACETAAERNHILAGMKSTDIQWSISKGYLKDTEAVPTMIKKRLDEQLHFMEEQQSRYGISDPEYAHVIADIEQSVKTRGEQLLNGTPEALAAYCTQIEDQYQTVTYPGDEERTKRERGYASVWAEMAARILKALTTMAEATPVPENPLLFK